MRGRPPKPLIKGKAPRLRAWREQRGWSQTELGQRAGMTQQTVSEIESGETQLKMPAAKKLADALNVSLTDLFPDNPVTIPLLWQTGSALTAPVAGADLPNNGRAERIAAPPRLANPEQCFAAEVVDDSADLVFPRGSFLVVRHMDALDKRLHRGNHVLVAVRGDDPSDIAEVFAGVLDASLFGDLLVLLRTRNRKFPASVAVRSAPAALAGFAERPHAYAVDDITYEARPDDKAVILGKIERVIAPT